MGCFAAGALSLSALEVPAALAQQTTLAAQAQTNATAFRDQIGRRLTFVCPAHVNINQDIYGTDNYSDTSPICTAAAHAGVFTHGTSTAVTIVMEGQQPSFIASSRNNVQSLAYGRWVGSYSFARTSQPGQIDWHTTLVQVADDYLTPFTLTCPPAGAAGRGEIWGTDVYPDDSAICVAGVHAGVITLDGGTLTVTRVNKQASFPSTTRNAITSRLWSDPAWRSYPQPYSVSNAGLVGGGGSSTSPIRAAGTGTIASTAPAPTGITGSIGATAGPITSSRNPVTSSNANVFGPPVPRSISLAPFTAAGGPIPIARTIGLPVFAAVGTSSAVSSRTIPLPQFVATGADPLVALRSIALPPFSASGTFITVAPRSLAQTAASNASVLPAPRAIDLPGFQANGASGLIASRTVQLPAYSALGGSSIVAWRTITLPAYASGGSAVLTPRTIKLPTFTTVGIP